MALNGTYENKKTRRLARSLQMPPWAALGMMEAMWAWARKAARTGRIEAYQWEDIAEFLQWQKSPEELRSVLLGAGLIDEMGGWDYIHHWDQHADDSIRKSLEKRGERFANGADTRRWKLISDEIPDRPEIGNLEPISNFGEKNSPQSPLIIEISPSTARTRPEPEPEPEPDRTLCIAAAAKSSSVVRPPPLAKQGHPEFEAYREALCSFMASGTPEPDDAIVTRVIWASNGAKVEHLVAKFREFAKTRHEPPKSYGFWPEVIAGWFAQRRKRGP